ncbi:glutathione S-transferase N-terminal domain-containing protein [Enterovirga sp. CN4-39]|uniref:glutathione S-transferase N-terminal domain-containing protein n=1 Tax=Enterovirga sp. CN4-39 TaxID=3400910 RepID=UPI003C027736
MITLYTWTTPNGRKASIMLEELGLEYEVRPVDLGKGEQFEPAFLKISPNNKIPAILDARGAGPPRVVFETAAILIHLAEGSGKLLPMGGPRRDRTLEWLVWSVAGLAPMLGQWSYFALRAEEKVPAAIDRFTKEAIRLFGVLERRLSEEPYLAGEYSIADISTYTWTKALQAKLRERAGPDFEPSPATDRWLAEVGARPAVQRGMEVPRI